MVNEIAPVKLNGKPKPKAVFAPHVDVIENPEAILMYADMPGVVTEDLDIRPHNGELAIAGRVRPRQKASKWLRKEYDVGGFYRSFQLSDEIDVTAITAELKNGELLIRLPKSERAKPIKIEVKNG